MIFAKLFEKKPNEKTIAKFWNEFQTRSDFYLDVIVKDDEDTDDYIFVRSCIRDGLIFLSIPRASPCGSCFITRTMRI